MGIIRCVTDSKHGIRAFVAVDVQPGFCEGGSLPVTGGNAVAERVAAFLDERRSEYGVVVATRDYHVDPGDHFSDEPDFQNSWPSHCVAGTEEAELHPALGDTEFDAVFDKGAHAAAYSGFEAAGPDGRLLGDFLRDRGVTEVDIAGLATDYCVAATARDAVGQGFSVRVLTDLAAGVAKATVEEALVDLEERGVRLETSEAA